MKKIIIILISIFFIVSLGVYCGVVMHGRDNTNEYNQAFYNNMIIQEENIVFRAIETSNIEEEITTPNTLIVYKTYYTKCKHYVREYKDIDTSLVNLTENKLKEKLANKWDIEKFSSAEIELSKEVEEYCNEHYKIKLENSSIVIYNIDENGVETEYEQTGITTEYLTGEDILKLSSGIYVYGKENLTSIIEDYE